MYKKKPEDVQPEKRQTWPKMKSVLERPKNKEISYCSGNFLTYHLKFFWLKQGHCLTERPKRGENFFTKYFMKTTLVICRSGSKLASA